MLLARWGHLVARRRLTVLALALIATAVTVVIGPTAMSRLSNGGWADPAAESTVMPERLAQTVGRSATDAIVLYTARPGTPAVADPAFEAAVTGSLAALPTDDVASSVTYWNSGKAPALVSADGRSTYALLQLAGSTSEARMEAFRDVEERLRDAGPGIEVRIGGEAGLNDEINTQVKEDLARAESLSAPLLLVLLVLVFGSLVAAGLPLLVGLVTVVGSFTVLRVLTEVTDVSVFAVNIITLLGLGLAIDYSLFLVNRFREELRRGRTVPDALSVTMATAGRTVAFSAITVAVSLSSLLLFAQPFLKSMAYGGVAAVLVAMLTSLTLLPALLALLGRRVDAVAVRLPGARRRAAAAGRRAAAGLATARPAAGSGSASPSYAAPSRCRWPSSPSSASSRYYSRTPASAASTPARCPPTAKPRRRGHPLREFPAVDSYVQVLVDGGGKAAAERWRPAVARWTASAASRVSRAAAQGRPAARRPPGRPMDDATLDLVREVRALPDPAGGDVAVGRSSARRRWTSVTASPSDCRGWPASWP
ncbi:MAG: MMPL family transporter [Kineosporiaceae bacterium]